MKVSGTSVLHAPPQQVWDAINDPYVLATVVPGCEGLTAITPGHFRLDVSLGVASIKGSYRGDVQFTDLDEPRSLIMHAAGAGSAGTINTTVRVNLADLEDGTTQLDYDAEAVVGGMVGGVGQRVLTSVARKTAGLFFAAIDEVLTGRRQVDRAGALPTAEEIAVGAPAAARPGTAVAGATRSWAGLVAAAAVGALAALVGVLVGNRIGRGGSS